MVRLRVYICVLLLAFGMPAQADTIWQCTSDNTSGSAQPVKRANFAISADGTVVRGQVHDITNDRDIYKVIAHSKGTLIAVTGYAEARIPPDSDIAEFKVFTLDKPLKKFTLVFGFAGVATLGVASGNCDELK